MARAFGVVPTHLLQVVRGYHKLPPFQGRTVRTVRRYPFNAVAVSEMGEVYASASCSVHVFSLDGVLLRAIGDGMFYHPWNMAVAKDGELVVVDRGNNRIEVFGPDGTFLRKWGGFGHDTGQFNDPQGVAVTQEGEVLVADGFNGRIQVFRLSTGAFVRQWGTKGFAQDQFQNPCGVCVTKAGEVRHGE